MRRDMSKVIVERPREGSRWKTWRRKGRYDPKLIVLDEDGEDDISQGRAAYRRATKSARHAKWLNENLAPLRRYLLGQIGRPWDAVWAEICAYLKPTSTVQQHVRDHVDDFVAVNTFIKDGRIYFSDRATGVAPLDNPKYRQPLAYVDPRSGVLQRNPYVERYGRRQQRIKAAEAAELAKRLRELPDRAKRLILLDDGNWWEITLAGPKTSAGKRTPATGRPEIADVIDSAGLSSLPREKRYGDRALVAIAKRPLSKRELKQYGLREG